MSSSKLFQAVASASLVVAASALAVDTTYTVPGEVATIIFAGGTKTFTVHDSTATVILGANSGQGSIHSVGIDNHGGGGGSNDDEPSHEGGTVVLPGGVTVTLPGIGGTITGSVGGSIDGSIHGNDPNNGGDDSSVMSGSGGGGFNNGNDNDNNNPGSSVTESANGNGGGGFGNGNNNSQGSQATESASGGGGAATHTDAPNSSNPNKPDPDDSTKGDNGHGGNDNTPGSFTVPSQDPFYKLPDRQTLSKAKPGDILRHRKTPKPIAVLGLKPLDFENTYQLLYKSTDSHGNDTASVLTVIVPHGADPRKVLSYQFEEDAAGVDCAPSYALQLGSIGNVANTISIQSEFALVEAALQQGWIVTIPDFEGPKAAFLARDLSAHLVLDGMRAAKNSASFTEISKDAAFAMWGYSGGGLASSAAAEEQPDYASELNIVGAAVGGLTPDILNVLYNTNKSPVAGLAAAGIAGLTNEFPRLDRLVHKLLKPEFKSQFEQLKHQCVASTVTGYLFKDVLNFFTDSDALIGDPWVKKLLHDNGLGLSTPRIPMFVYKGVLDQISKVQDTDDLVNYWCHHDVPSLLYYKDATGTSATTVVTGAGRALDFLHGVFEGKQQVRGCKTQTVVSGLADLKGSKYIPGYILKTFLDIIRKPAGGLFGSPF